MVISSVAILLVGACLAAFVLGMSGFAFGLIATAFWAWSPEPQLLVPTIVFGSLLGQIFSIRVVRHQFSLARARPFVIGGVIGVPIGVLLLRSVSTGLFTVGVGVVLVAYSVCMLNQSRLPVLPRVARLADSGVGLMTGILGGAGGIGGAAPVVWCSLRGWDKNVQRATFQPLFLVIQTFTLVIYAVTGAITIDTLVSFALISPVVVISSWLGARAYPFVSELKFQRLILALLFASGVSLLLRPLSRLL